MVAKVSSSPMCTLAFALTAFIALLLPLPTIQASLSSQYPMERNYQNADAQKRNNLASFWKRGLGGDSADRFWKRGINAGQNEAFWKRAPGFGQQAFWKRGPAGSSNMAFWKRAGADTEMDKLLQALQTLREFIEMQKERANRINKQTGIPTTAGQRSKATFEVIDPSTNERLGLSVNEPKEEARRDDPIMRPEFNPTGW